MVRLEHVHKRFTTKRQAVEAVNDVSLQVRTGEIYGIIGYSGAGKSTLVRCINMLEPPDSGKVYVDDVEMTSLSERQLRAQRARIGMIFQSFNLFASRTVRGNIAYPLQHRGIPKETIAAKVDEMLKLTGLEDKADAYPSQLSGGQKQRVAIARTLSTSPSLLLCDEATSALDPTTTHSILQLLKDLNKKLSITIIVITHQIEVVKAICDSVAVMENGHVVEQGSVFDVFANPRTRIAKQFIDSISALSKIDEFIANNDPVVSLEPGQRLIRLHYGTKSTSEPLITQVARMFDIDLNILLGDIELVEGFPLGGTICIASGERSHIDEAIAYFQKKGVVVEVIKQ